MRRFINTLNQWLAYTCGWMAIFIMLIICINVFTRQFFNISIIWVFQITNYFLVYMTFLAVPWVLAKKGHVSISVVWEKVSEGKQKMLDIITTTMGIVYSVFFTYFGIVEVIKLIQRNTQFIEAIYVPQWIVYLVFPFAGLLLTVQFVFNIIDIFKDYSAYKQDGDQELI